jgi:hypothetical protein
MGGTSSSQQSTNQESQVTPYGPAAAGLTGILGNLMPSVEAHGDQKQAVASVMDGLGWRHVGAHGLDLMFER